MRFKSVIVGAAITGAIGLASGCAKESGKKADEVYAGVQGSWVSNCSRGASAALLGQADLGITQHSELKITKKQVQETSYITSSECEGRDIEIVALGSYKTTGGEMDISDITYKVKPLTEFGLRVLRLSQFCGISDWAFRESRDVTEEIGKPKCFTSRQASARIAVNETDLHVKESDRLQASSYAIKPGLSYKRR